MKMLRILRKTVKATSVTGGSSLEASDYVEGCGVVDDLSSWVVIDASESEDDYAYSDEDLGGDDDDDATSDVDLSPGREPETVGELEPVDCVPKSVHIIPVNVVVEDVGGGQVDDEDQDEPVLHDDEEDDGDDDDDRFDYSLDDELVPWSLKNRFGKQRLRKMGKRGGPKANKSKRLPYHSNRPGCLYGKHGLGVQRCFI